MTDDQAELEADLAAWEALAATVTPYRHNPPAQTLKSASRPSVASGAKQPLPTSKPPRPLTPVTIDQLPHKTKRALRRGDWTVDATLDLHGHTLESGHHAVAQLIAKAHQQQWRCLLVITGKGLRSPGARQTLQKALPEWLALPSLAPYVLSHTHASPAHGGSGAYYVLLRKDKKR